MIRPDRLDLGSRPYSCPNDQYICLASEMVLHQWYHDLIVEMIVRFDFGPEDGIFTRQQG